MALSSCKKDEEEPVPSTLVATSNYANMIGPWWATLNGSVNPNNLTVTVSFEYDTISSSYSKNTAGDPATVTGNSTTNVIAHLWDLVPGKKYYFRIKVVTSTGTVYGTEKTFNTSDTIRSEILYNDGLNYGSVTDIEGNTYKTIQIGAQTWMAQNLQTTK
jgi:phosphodiesterase/alkaline phosphatase D-like protein